MTNNNKTNGVMMNRNTQARLAGLGYLILIVAGIFGMVYVPAKIFNWSDPAQTLLNLNEDKLLFRMAITGSLISYTAFAVVSALFYRLFAEMAKLPALLLLCFRVLGAAVYMSNALNYVEIITLLSGPPQAEIAGQDLLSLAANFNNGFTFIQSTTGVWLVSLSILTYKSRFLPRVMSVLLMYSGAVNYVGDFFITFIFEKDLLFLLSLPGTLGEFSTCLWLIVVGAGWQKPQPEKLRAHVLESEGSASVET